jgi:hypothetical protein
MKHYFTDGFVKWQMASIENHVKQQKVRNILRSKENNSSKRRKKKGLLFVLLNL